MNSEQEKMLILEAESFKRFWRLVDIWEVVLMLVAPVVAIILQTFL